VTRIREVNLFGSGFPATPRRYQPQMLVRENFTIVYDSNFDPADLEKEAQMRIPGDSE
jgi:hypothetical protein